MSNNKQHKDLNSSTESDIDSNRIDKTCNNNSLLKIKNKAFLKKLVSDLTISTSDVKSNDSHTDSSSHCDNKHNDSVSLESNLDNVINVISNLEDTLKKEVDHSNHTKPEHDKHHHSHTDSLFKPKTIVSVKYKTETSESDSNSSDSNCAENKIDSESNLVIEIKHDDCINKLIEAENNLFVQFNIIKKPSNFGWFFYI